ncbi:hypothetical protein PLEOSDRAFT_1048122, partial [Pleurotus ostreatus PC15]
PVVLALSDEDPEIGLEFLVSPFCLSVGLRVVCSGGSQLDSEHPVDFPGELCNELRTPVGHHGPRESVQLPDVCGSKGGHCGVSWNEVGAFAYGVDHVHDSVKSIGLRKLNDEVDTQMIPAFIRNWKRMEFTHGQMPLGLRPETEVAMAGVGSDVPGHVGPPVAA